MPKFGVLGAYPPALCGLANFTAALTVGLSAEGADVSVVRLGDGDASDDPRVVGELVSGHSRSLSACADRLSEADVVVVHFDFDVYGGRDGDDVLQAVRALTVPSIVVVHSVPSRPTDGQRSVLEALVGLADRVVVPSDVARQRLCRDFAAEAGKVSAIPRGASIPKPEQAKRGGRPTLLTWGLLGPGKGVERVIGAMTSLHELRGQPRYLFAGPTHPAVVKADGETYREACTEQARQNGLAGSVSLDPAYRRPHALAALVQACAVVVLPYDSTDQVASDVLVDAVTSGRPVVATAFPHAVELLGSGAGIVVGHDDPDAMASALRTILTDPRVAGAMAGEGRRLAPELNWSAAAKSYITLAQGILRSRRLDAAAGSIV